IYDAWMVADVCDKIVEALCSKSKNQHFKADFKISFYPRKSNASSSKVVAPKEFESGLNEEIASTAIAMIDAGKYEVVPEALSI
ncbi:hypothetical protein GIB67_040695, partial [Kingdonia uniflora]